jgi:branched-chain amino acid transport system permease protein
MFASVGEDVFRAFLQGMPTGTVFALIALGFVLTYKTSGIFNLAFGAQAYVSAAMYFKCRVEWEWPIVPAVIVSVVLLAPAIGLVLERLIFRHLRTASSVAKLVVAIGLSVALPNLFDLVANFEAVAGRTPEGIVPDGSTVFYDPFGVYSFSRNELVAMGVAVLGMLSLGALFRFTAIGLQMRAVVESPKMTELNGIRADRVSAFAWALSSLFAGTAGVLIAPRFNTLVAPDFFNLVVVGIAAAAVGRLVNLRGALIGGFGLGIFIALFDTFLPRWAEDIAWLRPIQDNITPAVPFVVLFGVLVLWPAIRRSREAADPMAGVEPPPPSLAATTRSPRVAAFSRIMSVILLGLILLVVFTRADVSWLFLVTQAVILATIYLSITVITGMAGQISLCQGAFAAIGGFSVFQLVERYDMSVLGAALIGAVIAAVVGAVLSLPVLRLGGIWVAIATLAFAFFFDAVLVKLSWVGGGSSMQGTRVPRPTIGSWDMANDKSFLALAIVVFAVVSAAVILLREGTVGRTLRALRGSEVAAESIGISPTRARMTAFAVSAFIAGLGGAMLSIHQENVNYGNNFAPFAALFWVVIVVSLGSRTVEGAGQAGAAFALFDTVVLRGEVFGWILRSPDRIPGIFPISPKWRFVLFGLGTLQFARHPEGLVENGKRKSLAKLEKLFGGSKGSADGDAPSAGAADGADAAGADPPSSDGSDSGSGGGAAGSGGAGAGTGTVASDSDGPAPAVAPGPAR